ncbi:hypothetical protein AAFC00_005144 [Neodothiora populina]|uniref:BHLH domain-containing protein n=1 Tax=Neodothiora populina TaxID=2781224 RepID=A0ABR3PL39_9PEZI
MPFSHFMHMNYAEDQDIAGFYGQSPISQELGIPTSGSLDSGYAEVEPFDKTSRYPSSTNLDFNQTCSIGTGDESTLDFGNFAFSPILMQPNESNIGAYTVSPRLDTKFQRLVDSMQPYQTSSSVGDTSEDGHLASVSSGSPQHAPSEPGASPQRMQQQQQQKNRVWDNMSTNAIHKVEDSPVEVVCKTEEPAAPKTAPSRGRPRKRIPHTAVERRYRENLNAHLEKLRSAVPNLTAAQRRKATDGADPMKPSKCEVLIGAVEYIKRLEDENERLKRKSNEV